MCRLTSSDAAWRLTAHMHICCAPGKEEIRLQPVIRLMNTTECFPLVTGSKSKIFTMLYDTTSWTIDNKSPMWISDAQETTLATGNYKLDMSSLSGALRHTQSFIVLREEPWLHVTMQLQNLLWCLLTDYLYNLLSISSATYKNIRLKQLCVICGHRTWFNIH